MLSCSPKAWRRHLDGCAALIQALGITHVSGGLGQALFSIFARMDMWASLISSERTLIPVDKWIGAGDIHRDIEILRRSERHASFDLYANHITYLCGRVVDLLCASGKWEAQHHRNRAPPNDTSVLSPADYLHQWTALHTYLETWHLSRPEEMQPILTIPNPPTSPFPQILYGNGPAVAGTQMYHTAALIMLKYKPPHTVPLTLPPPPSQSLSSTATSGRKPPSILHHARQICAISLSNNHHGCWTNSIQPLWVAGQHMSHASEHRAILDLYGHIERETGWATRWRADDLKEYWGEL